ncbi:glycoside hydrolase superfamily [Gymnopilus junonius]|uniref:Glycoside hydrolase superfamily n=1 Tax=Gymnopilus junonius TaxID=109634 RepID=A0A9P5NN79_GYMJU|nr:glycoside hydrolase superfamily [Gymnopilus junonius]
MLIDNALVILLPFSLLATGHAIHNSTISAAWYAGWHAKDFPLSQVSWSKYTHLTYAFALTTPDLIPQFVSMAQQHDVVGPGSRWFSSNVRTAQNRTAFVRTVTNLAQKYHLDGLDFDWEFPGVQGIGCNVVDPSDTVNFFSFLQELRNSTIGEKLILSAATEDTPWVSSTGMPSANVSQFSQVLDFIEIMNYDIKSNPASGAGSSSPLNDSCAPVGARFGSAVSAVDAWMAAGIPADKIVLGVPAYGHSFVTPTQSTEVSNGSSSSSNSTLPLYPPYNSSVEHPGDKWDGDGGVDVCGVMQGPGEGFLNQDGSVADDIKFRFDDCSQTRCYVAYENPQSYASKGGFIRSAGLKGFAMWEAGGDLNDTLLDSILNATQKNGPPASSAPTTNAKSSATSARLMRAQSVWLALLAIVLVVITK